MPKDKELQDHERAHNGKPGMKVRHGQATMGLETNQKKYEQAFNRHVQNTDGDIQEARRRAKDEVFGKAPGIPMRNMNDFDKL